VEAAVRISVNKLRHTTLILAFFLVAAATLGAQSPKLLVSAAASLTDVLGSLEPEAEKAVGMPIQFNFGASGSLRAQIENGAPVDVFFSAAAADMDKLDKACLLVPGTRGDLLANAIVLIAEGNRAPISGIDDLKSLLSGASVLAIGNPDSVPAGRYAVQALKNLGLFSLVDGRLALGGTVREVLQFVQSGSAPLGIVFLTDAMSVKAGAPVAVVYRFPPSALTDRVVYPAAVVAASENQAAAARFLAFLRSPLAQGAFVSAGFEKP
jgi:molybdate transport system substrate-binding protein